MPRQKEKKDSALPPIVPLVLSPQHSKRYGGDVSVPKRAHFTTNIHSMEETERWRNPISIGPPLRISLKKYTHCSNESNFPPKREKIKVRISHAHWTFGVPGRKNIAQEKMNTKSRVQTMWARLDSHGGNYLSGYWNAAPNLPRFTKTGFSVIH